LFDRGESVTEGKCFLEYGWHGDFAETIDVPGFVSLSASPLSHENREQPIRPSQPVRHFHE
jgi:hypothetical protein